MLTLLIAILAASLIGFLFIKPYFEYRFYRSQGHPGYFIPIVGLIYGLINNRKVNKDSFFGYKSLLNKNPAAEMYIMNIASTANIHIIGLKSIKEFYQNHLAFKKGKLTDHLELLIKNGLLFSEGT